MKKNLKLLIWIGAFILLIGGASLTYNKLRENTGNPDNLARFDQSENSETSGSTTQTKESSATSEDAPASTETAANTDSQVNGETVNESEAEILEAPDFNVVNADGETVSLSAYRGKPVVINFWASWCPPCQEEMPEFERVYQELGKDVHFLMVDMVDGQRETQAKGQAFIDDNGFTFPIYFDLAQEAAYAYGVRSIPMTFFVNSEGHLVAGSQGMIDEEILRKGIEMVKD